MALKTSILALFLLNMIFCFDIFSNFQVNGKEVPDPVRTSDHGFDVLSPDKRFDSFANGFGEAKRSFDEISRSSFGFNKRRDFDEIGRSSFGFNKRKNFDEIGRSSFGFAKKDDLHNSYDLSSADVAHQLDMMKRGDFDEIGRSSFGFYRRSPQTPRSGWRFFSNFGKRNANSNEDYVEKDVEDKRFDEINRSAFGFSHRNAK